MIYREQELARMGRKPEVNPLIPVCLEYLFNYKRTAALSRTEYLQLF